MNPLIIVFFVVWTYIIWVLYRAKLKFWKFIIGAAGLFIFLMILLEPIAMQPLARTVAAIAGIPGQLSGAFTTYFKYGIIFVNSANASMTLMIDFECSGIVEIFAFISLIAFYEVYKPYERILVGFIGTFYIILANALRIILICFALHFIGPGCYYIMHSIVGRLFFYAMSIVLYFYVFTKPQIVSTRVGSFGYEHA